MADIINASMSNSQSAEEIAAHEAKMIAAADGGVSSITAKDSQNAEGEAVLTASETEVAPEVTPRPDDVPEKFWDSEKGEINVAALLQSQKDGEAALRGNKPEAEVETPVETEEAAAPVASVDNIAAATAEFAENGELSSDTYEALASAGLSNEMVNEYIAGQQAIVAGLEAAAYGTFDGKENYDAAVTWAQENLSEEQIGALDAQITSSNPGIVRQGAEALQRQFIDGSDLAPTTTVTGTGSNSNSGAAFRSGAEMRTAMADPRYKTDSAFRAEVSAKIAGADRQGINLFM